ncbi:WecB/TagA/CpsF family glycosyltransferase [Atopococcus tabaci]|uniref:WecB/TagA/CpsF family glycosyltransferase n=1 Tax=Atopococcus tabaci TaxID=269774 RepID=UPI002409C78C|nr:WecB/TagA/CpsF family glycosyltransferase [Atopococcus tabaci]
MASEKVTILGVPFDNFTHEEFVHTLEKRLHAQQKTFVVTANPEIVMYAHAHPEYADILSEADFIAPDGIGVVKASRVLNTPIKERVPGYELMLDLLDVADREGHRVYFLGARQEVIEKLVATVPVKWPGLTLAGWHHGYFDHTDEKMMDRVHSTHPDLIFVALGYPAQEQWIHDYMKQADKGLAMGVGGSFDVLSGTTKRAPKWVRKFHVEWLYRLVKQPSRWRRMLAIPRFLGSVRVQKKGKKVTPK